MRASIKLIDESQLDFSEYFQPSPDGTIQVVTYSYYNWTDSRDKLILRWDNTPQLSRSPPVLRLSSPLPDDRTKIEHPKCLSKAVETGATPPCPPAREDRPSARTFCTRRPVVFPIHHLQGRMVRQSRITVRPLLSVFPALFHARLRDHQSGVEVGPIQKDWPRLRQTPRPGWVTHQSILSPYSAAVPWESWKLPCLMGDRPLVGDAAREVSCGQSAL